jgi:hypothetical protein
VGTYQNTTWGFSLTLPPGWTRQQEDNSTVAFLSPDRTAVCVVFFGPAPAGLTAQARIQEELQSAVQSDPSFQPSSVAVNTGTLGGQPAAGTAEYRYAASNGNRRSEADFAVVLPGRAQYLFAFVTPQGQFNAHGAEFDAILDSIRITGP